MEPAPGFARRCSALGQRGYGVAKTTDDTERGALSRRSCARRFGHPPSADRAGRLRRRRHRLSRPRLPHSHRRRDRAGADADAGRQHAGARACAADTRRRRLGVAAGADGRRFSGGGHSLDLVMGDAGALPDRHARTQARGPSLVAGRRQAGVGQGRAGDHDAGQSRSPRAREGRGARQVAAGRTRQHDAGRDPADRLCRRAGLHAAGPSQRPSPPDAAHSR